MHRDVFRALEFAAIAHQGQLRSSPDKKIPYIVHPLDVVRRLYLAGADTETCVIGALHDTVEDTDVILSEIEFEFGKSVARGVDLVTLPPDINGKKDPKRKIEYQLRVARDSYSAREAMVKAADIGSNLDSLIFYPPKWSVKSIRGYTIDKMTLLETLTDVINAAHGPPHHAGLQLLQDAKRAGVDALNHYENLER